MNIGVTGCIGSGKTTVCRMLASSLFTDAVSCDELCRQELKPGQDGLAQVRQRWGDRFITVDEKLNRPALRTAAFGDPQLRHELEMILHPLVLKKIATLKKRAGQEGKSLVVEVPLLYESGWQRFFDFIVVARVTTEQILARVGRRDGRSREEIQQILNAQMSPEEKAEKSDYVIDNSGTFGASFAQVVWLSRILRRGGGL